MSRLFKAWLMFLVLGLVLPLAGAPLRYCLCAQTVVVDDDSCCSCEDEHGCDCDQECPHPPEVPSCTVTLEVLPDAIPQCDHALPAPLVAEVPTPAFELPVAIVTVNTPFDQTHDRGPPTGPPLYLRHRSLLL